jgi:uncharacterized delta-60 repeat protein
MPALSGIARAVALQPDGKVVVSGETALYPGNDFALARYNVDGSLDLTFGIQGKITTDFGATDEAYAMALQPDGKIVIAGSSRSGPVQTFERFAVARYNSDGSLDTTFGVAGKITTDFSTPYSHASAVVLQPDGKIVVAGYALPRNSGPNLYSSDFAVARYDNDGSLDLTYGVGGKVTTDFSGRSDAVYALTLQPDGKIIAVGRSNNFFDSVRGGMAFARYNNDGSLDPTFGVGGQIADYSDDHSFPGIARAAYAVALQSDGKIVAGGGSVDVESGLRLTRLNQDGSLDETFVSHDADIGLDAWTVVLQADGKILTGSGIESGLWRFNSDGSLDTTLVFEQSAGEAAHGVTALAVQPDGNIIAARGDFSLARYTSQLPTLSIDPPTIHLGDSFTATFSGASLNNETYFDVRFRAPGSSTDQMALNWQRGLSATHRAPAGAPTGTWTVTGVHPHKNINDHTPAFVPVSIDLNVVQ